MNKILTAAFLAATLSTGCVMYVPGDYDPEVDYVPANPGDVTFHWTFASQLCNEVPEVKSVYIHIPGETLQNDGVYPCTAGGFAGIVLFGFEGGSYTYTVEALDYSNEAVFTAGGSFQVDGNVRVNVDLTPLGSPASYAYLSWDFPANSDSNFPNCEMAGVAYVDVSIDGARSVRYACNQGFGMGQVQTPYLSAGTHSIELTAKSEDDYPYYSYRGSLQTYAGSPISAEYSLKWAVGGVALRWSFSGGQSCTGAGVQTMTLNFEDSAGNLVYGPTGDVQACDSAPIVYNYLLPGSYRVYIQGTGPGGTFLSDTRYPVTVTVRAGQFVTEANAVTVPLYKR
jgi:hypothetical protein